MVGDDNEVLVIDAAHDADAIAEAVGDRRVVAVVCTHAHDDHVDAAPALADRVGAPILLHPADRPLWQHDPPGPAARRASWPTATAPAGGTELTRAAHPGPLARRGLPVRPRAGRPCSPATPCSTAGRARPAAPSPTSPTIIDSIRDRLLTLPADTHVLTGHGDATTIGAEAPHLRRVDRARSLM